MDTSWLIVGLVVMLLLGSISWAMPSPAQRAQGKLRTLAMAKGLRVKIVKLQGPREQGELESIERVATAYSLLRSGKDNEALGVSHQWQVFRANGALVSGLPQGWCWHKGDKLFQTKQVEKLGEFINALPNDVFAITGSPLSIDVYWNESGTTGDVLVILAVLQGLLADSI